ncbi:hypothetical protein [Piscibacillus halophilus]|uniref:hypothetical protein n=1 Tax=Piscibacillus halophilus TaxID=571933 RepID=UPI00158E2304|nr:hypothetical protein [Piscibacillus halophilus]
MIKSITGIPCDTFLLYKGDFANKVSQFANKLKELPNIMRKLAIRMKTFANKTMIDANRGGYLQIKLKRNN